MWKKEGQREAFAEALVEIGSRRKDVVVLTADLSSSVKTNRFAEKFPEHHFNVGISEQNMMSIAAGLAASGSTVFASTFAVFGTSRVYDQIRQSIAWPKLNVNIVATHAGITVGGDGASHQMLEDIALMCSLPNMTVIVPCDALETRKAVKSVVDYKGPTYIRLGRSEVPIITQENDTFSIGKATVMKDGKDITLIGTGIMVSRCLLAAEKLEKENIDASVINMSTIKPVDEKTIIKYAKETGAIVTAEEHNIIGGLGSTVSSVLSENVPVPMKRIGIPDVFGESGKSDELMEKYGLTPENIVKAVHDVMKRRRK
ncbi:MAG: transketolase [Euryarchaeota archaeon CG_4_9_14_3_um_filter_38_12]|nr:MAG: transketolase [Euryarchaeota archaeon CG_4_9_14_3_um_filter_38_12]